jgi:hypothetical protein
VFHKGSIFETLPASRERKVLGLYRKRSGEISFEQGNESLLPERFR